MATTVLHRPVILYETLEALYQYVNETWQAERRSRFLAKAAQRSTPDQQHRLGELTRMQDSLMEEVCRDVDREDPRILHFFRRWRRKISGRTCAWPSCWCIPSWTLPRRPGKPPLAGGGAAAGADRPIPAHGDFAGCRAGPHPPQRKPGVLPDEPGDAAESAGLHPGIAILSNGKLPHREMKVRGADFVFFGGEILTRDTPV